MGDTQQDIERLYNLVDTARQEIELAIMLHETWRPAAYDIGLHTRIGTSYAAHSFQIIRLALRRELLLALTRVWDKSAKAVRMSLIADLLRDKKCFEALVQYRVGRTGIRSRFTPETMREELTPKLDQVLKLIRKYQEGGAAYEVRKKLKTIRDEHLAHRELPKGRVVAVTGSDTLSQKGEEDKRSVRATDDEIETFYQDNLEIMRLLLSLVQGVAIDFSDACAVYKHHAKFFWASTRGECTEGHPYFHPRPSDP
ncbi:AbiU2 domain-containing protein [Pseudomonas helleri]|uniref:AbiU2 domain-containing protein n=1 Tax=Pseudomonas helleri TaxID=1608996 RepID=UPI0012964CC3|nr:hypothetical protein [Pseudomonas helleri]MQT33858.1 hypothetical protein [Pseudomonas helleri]